MKFKQLTLSIGTAVLAALLCVMALEVLFRVIDPMKSRNNRKGKDISAKPQLFRTALPPEQKPAGEFRIVVLGDSYTWGDGIENENDLWTAVLQKKLCAVSERNIRVINMGMCGLTTVNELELLVGFAQKFSPDLVIVQYLINDALPSGPGLMRVGEEWLSSSKRKNIFSDAKLHEKAKSASYLYAFLNDRFLTLQRKLSKTMTWKDLYADDSPGFLMQKRALSEFGRWMQKSGVKIMFVLFPSFPKGRYTADNFPNADIYIKVKHLAEQHGLLTLNLIPVYTEKGDDFSRWFVSPSNGHPNEEASRIAADAMNRFIEENKLIPHQ